MCLLCVFVKQSISSQLVITCN